MLFIIWFVLFIRIYWSSWNLNWNLYYFVILNSEYPRNNLKKSFFLFFLSFFLFFLKGKKKQSAYLVIRLIWQTYRLFSEREIRAKCEYPKVRARRRIEAVFWHRLPNHQSSHVILRFGAVLSEIHLTYYARETQGKANRWLICAGWTNHLLNCTLCLSWDVFYPCWPCVSAEAGNLA